MKSRIRRNLGDHLTKEDEGDVVAEASSGHSHMHDFHLASGIVGALEETHGLFSPSGKGKFSEVKDGDLGSVDAIAWAARGRFVNWYMIVTLHWQFVSARFCKS